MSLFDRLFGGLLEDVFDGGAPIVAISRDALEVALAASRDSHPNEFMAALEARDADAVGADVEGRVITDVLMIPGTTSGEAMAQMRDEMRPIGTGRAGTVHSHPSGSTRPSEQDRRLFGKRGSRHIIVGAPYGLDDWTCYDKAGDAVELAVVDLEDDVGGVEADLDEMRGSDGRRRDMRGSDGT